MARPTGLIRAYGPHPTGALRASKTMARFVEPVPPVFGGHSSTRTPKQVLL